MFIAVDKNKGCKSQQIDNLVKVDFHFAAVCFCEDVYEL